jgi:hypothetical protein
VIAAVLLSISVVALGQFGIYYWRATIAEIASRPVSECVRLAARISTPLLGSRDFRAIMEVHDLAPHLRGPGGAFRCIRAYYSVAKCLGRLIPSMTSWAEQEMTTCSRYVAVLLGERLEHNLACSAHIRAL